LCAFFDGFTNGVEEQIYICGKVDVGFDHKGVTATAEADVVFFLPRSALIVQLPD
jgi:hypothetical protein